MVNKVTKNSMQHFSKHANGITVLPVTVRMSRSKIPLSSHTRLNTQEKIQVSKHASAPLFTNSGDDVLNVLQLKVEEMTLPWKLSFNQTTWNWIFNNDEKIDKFPSTETLLRVFWLACKLRTIAPSFIGFIWNQRLAIPLTVSPQ